MFKTQDFTLEFSGVAIFAIELERSKVAPADFEPPVARILDIRDGLRPLDSLVLALDEELYPDGCRLFASAYAGKRDVRLEIVGTDAENWTVRSGPYIHQQLHENLSGYAEWYANREKFYGEEYFQSEGDGASGYDVSMIAQARASQERFVAPLFDNAPFRSSIEFGCAAGAMVEALRARGVNARGVDLSSYAISQADKSVREHLTVGDFSILDNLEMPVEAVIGQEVFEHIPPSDVPKVFRKIHEVTTRWLILTSPCMPTPGLTLIDNFEELPRDSRGNPIQGHLVQGTWWWYALEATLAGFVVEVDTIQKIRRRWHDNSRWWNLYVCRRTDDNGHAAVQRRIDDLLSLAYEPMRQRLDRRRVACGRMVRRPDRLVLSCKTTDAPAYAHYGPYLKPTGKRVRVSFVVRHPNGGAVEVEDPSLPALAIELQTSRGVRSTYCLPVQHLLEVRGRWVRRVHDLDIDGDEDVQIKIYFVGNADLELAWPVECYDLDGAGLRA